MEYAKLPGLTPDGTMYWNEEMGTMEAVLPPGGYKTAHGPGLLELENGDLLCVWFAGSFEGNADVNVICARLKKGSSRWEEPVLVSHDPDRSEQNPSLFAGPDGKVWAMYTSQLSRVEGKDNMQFTSVIRCQKSADGGETWSDYETVFPEEGSFCRQPIQVLESGRWIFGNWICTDSELGLTGDPTAFRISDDQGKTWKTVDMPEEQRRGSRQCGGAGAGTSGCVHEKPRGRPYLPKRIHGQRRYLDCTGAHVLPNNNSSISAVKLKSGRIAVALQPYLHTLPDTRRGFLAGSALPGSRCAVRGRRPYLPHDPLYGTGRGVHGC